MLRAATSLALPGGKTGKLSTFIFHRVLDKSDPLMRGEPDAIQFDNILGWIGKQFQILDPTEASERLQSGSLPARAAVITFDDGYLDNHEIALPALQRHRMTAAFFIATGFTGGGAMFNDRVLYALRNTSKDELQLDWLDDATLPLRTPADKWQSFGKVISAVKYLRPADRSAKVEGLVQQAQADAPDKLMMDESHLQSLAKQGMTIGAHTRTHPILAQISDAQAAHEIVGGRADLHDIVGRAPTIFAYPNGKPGDDYLPVHRQQVADAGFSCAFSTQAGVSTFHTDKYQLRRFTPWDRSRWRFGLRMLVNARAANF